MRLDKCWFCSSAIYPRHGIPFVRNDAKIFRFCRSKCHKNFKMKRNPRKVKWTKAYRRLHGKDMTQDSTFERKLNRPERYDRNLAENTLKAIKKIDKVRVDREARHHKLSSMQDERKESQRPERGCKRARAGNPSRQSPVSFGTGFISHSSEDCCQGISSETGRQNGGVSLLRLLSHGHFNLTIGRLLVNSVQPMVKCCFLLKAEVLVILVNFNLGNSEEWGSMMAFQIVLA